MTYSGTSWRYLAGTALKSRVENVGLVARSVYCAALDDVAHEVAGHVGLEERLDGGDRLGLLGHVLGDELGELLLQQLVLALEVGDEAEDLLQDLAQGDATVDAGGLAQLLQRVVLLGLVEDLAVHVVDDAVPLAGLDGVAR